MGFIRDIYGMVFGKLPKGDYTVRTFRKTLGKPSKGKRVKFKV